MPFLPTAASTDEEFGLDEKVRSEKADLSLDNAIEGESRHFRPFRSGALWLSMAALDVVLALVWRNIGANFGLTLKDGWRSPQGRAQGQAVRLTSNSAALLQT